MEWVNGDGTHPLAIGALGSLLHLAGIENSKISPISFAQRKGPLVRTGSLIILAGCILLSGAQAAWANPLKIAVIEALSGPQAAIGKIYENAARAGIANINAAGGVSGEPAQLKLLDSEGGVSNASEKLKEAISEGVEIIVQSGSSAIGAQLSEDVRRYNLRNPAQPILFLNMGSEASDLTGSKCNYYSFRLAGTSTLRANALLRTMKAENALGTRVYTINSNVAPGQETEAVVVANAGPVGYSVAGAALHDVFRIQDFSPFIAKIAAAKPTAVITSNFSNDLLLLIKAGAEAQLPVVWGGNYLDQPGNAASVGQVLLGSYEVNLFNSESDRTTLTEDFKKLIGKYPQSSEGHATSMYGVLQQALSKADMSKDRAGRINSLIEALEKISYRTPMGDVSMRREDHQLILPLVVSKGTKEGIRFPLDGTSIGFATVAIVPGKDVIYPVQESCKMVRP
jgi:branched-chain amino acid transport system substrate-binding protein